MIIAFGKYRGKTVEYVMSEEPSYIGWAIEKGLIHVEEKIKSVALDSLRDERLEGYAFALEHENAGDR